MTDGTRYQVIVAFIESEFRAAAQLAQWALRALKNDKPSEAREHVTKARLYFMAALVHLRQGQTNENKPFADADRLDDTLREIERLIEHRVK